MDSLNEILELREERFKVISNAFGAEPSEAECLAILEDARECAGGVAGAAGADDPEATLAKDLAALTFEDPSSFATFVRTEYARLFIGPRAVLAPMHESAYLSGIKRMFTRETLEVRAFYKNFGYAMVRKNKEPDDSINTEMEFLGNLCGQCLQELSGLQNNCEGQNNSESGNKCEAENNSEPVKDILQAIANFEDEHLMLWAFEFAKLVIEHDETGYWSAWASYLVNVLNEEKELAKLSLQLA